MSIQVVDRIRPVPPPYLLNERHVGIQCTAKQRQLLDAILCRPDISQVGIGGRRGAGKTFIVCLCVTLRALYYENTEHLCIRRVQKSADLNLGREFRKVFKALGLPMGTVKRGKIQWDVKDKIFSFPNGSIIELGFCMKENDWERYQGREVATFWMAEATQFPEIAWRLIGGSNRSVTNPKCPGKKIADFNPGGIGHETMNRIFCDEKTRERRTVWIPAGIRDSAAVLEHDPGYVLRTLRGLPDWLRRQWEDGDMDAIAGQYFQVPPDQIVYIPPHEIPRHADWYGGVDYGTLRPFACIYMARWKEWHSRCGVDNVMRWKCIERAHIFREVYQAGLNYDEQAREVNDAEKAIPPHRGEIVYYADPSTGRETEHASTEVGRSIRDWWAMCNFFAHPATTNSKVPGWNLIKLLLKNGILTISPECPALLSEMRAAMTDGAPGPPKSEHMQDGDHVMNHALDALRYACVSTFGLNYSVEGHDAYAQPGEYPEEN